MNKLCLLTAGVLLLGTSCSKVDASGNFKDDKKSIVVQGFTSADRAFADVRGDASCCTVITTDLEQSGDTLVPAEESLVTKVKQVFDSNGYISKVHREDMYMHQPVGQSLFEFEFDSIGTLVSSASDLNGRFGVSRDKNGYVASFTSINSAGDIDYKQIYKWDGDRLVSQSIANDHHPVDSDGNPIPQPKDVATFVYDDNGYLISETEESGDPQLQINITTTEYKYNDLDSLGNWTDRNVVRTAKVYTVKGGKRELTDSIATYQREQRVIDY